MIAALALVLAVVACIGVVGLAAYCRWDYLASVMDGEDTVRRLAREGRRKQ